METTMQHLSSQESTDALTAWERWLDASFVWMPYVTLAISLLLAQVANEATSDRLLGVGLAAAAAAWTWLTFTRKGPPRQLGQPRLRLYFIGFVVIATLLMFTSTMFLVYGITGFFHAALLRPWWTAFSGIAAAGMIVHSHIVITESTTATWAIYLGIVTIQTVAVGAGLYGGQRISEVADARRASVERLEATLAENAGLHDQLVAQAREAGVLDERQRMAREIHDTIAQGLTGVITQIEAIQQTWDDEDEAKRRLAITADLARQSLTEARRSVQAVRPAPLEDSRLPEALADVSEQWAEINVLPVQFHTEGTPYPLRPDVEVALLRATQEGLANVAKHAAASRVGVTLTFMETTVALDIRDDGCGFDQDSGPAAGSFGLTAMQQRVESLHGAMHVESEPGIGTAVSVRVPAGRGGAVDV